MPLVTRTDGNQSQNIINSSWFNDIRNLLTGVMQDQEVKIHNLLIVKAIGAAPAAAASGALASGTTLGIGSYVYVYTYANDDGESKISPTFSITTTSGNQKTNLTGITIGPTGTTKRNIYRTSVGGGTTYKFLAALNDNTTTTYSDVIADGSLGAVVANTSTFGGAIILQDSTGAVTFKIANDGLISPAGLGNTTVTGTLSVTGLSTLASATLSGTLNVTGTSTQGTINGTNITASGTLGVTGSSTLHSTTVTGLTVSSGLTVSASGADITGSSTFHSGLTVTGGTLTTGAISSSGTITSSAGFNITGGTLSALTNGLSRINAFSASATTTTTAFNHGLGAAPDWEVCMLTGISTTPHRAHYHYVGPCGNRSR